MHREMPGSYYSYCLCCKSTHDALATRSQALLCITWRSALLGATRRTLLHAGDVTRMHHHRRKLGCLPRQARRTPARLPVRDLVLARTPRRSDAPRARDSQLATDDVWDSRLSQLHRAARGRPKKTRNPSAVDRRRLLRAKLAAPLLSLAHCSRSIVFARN